VPAPARRILLSCAAFAALALPASASAAACPGADVAPTDPAAAGATLCLLNAARADYDLPALSRSAPLDAAAGGYAQDMVDGRFFDHVSPDGSTMLQRIKAAGWVPAGAWTAGENIAWGSAELGSPARIVDSWLHSAGHRANILNGAFAEIGIGIASGAPQLGVRAVAGTYVTDFASRGGATAAKKKPPVARCALAKRARHGSTRRCARR
jgi:uncharacterized protein YkwD